MSRHPRAPDRTDEATPARALDRARDRAPDRTPDRTPVFVDLYQSSYVDLHRFVQRRVHQGEAEDVVADAFLVAWRRLQHLPRDRDDARAWLFGIARGQLLNTERGRRRREALGVRLADEAALVSSPESPDDLAERRVDLARAWRLLPERHQEALALAALEDLDAPHAAAVLGISPVAFRLRLSRARRALRLHLDHSPRPATTAAAPEASS